MQSLTFSIFTVSMKITSLKLLLHTDTRPAGLILIITWTHIFHVSEKVNRTKNKRTNKQTNKNYIARRAIAKTTHFQRICWLICYAKQTHNNRSMWITVKYMVDTVWVYGDPHFLYRLNTAKAWVLITSQTMVATVWVYGDPHFFISSTLQKHGSSSFNTPIFQVSQKCRKTFPLCHVMSPTSGSNYSRLRFRSRILVGTKQAPAQ